MYGAYDIDVTPLRNALGRLQKSLAYCGSELAASDPGLAEQFKAAAIQAFEFTYELSHKTLRRQLEALRKPSARAQFLVCRTHQSRPGHEASTLGLGHLVRIPTRAVNHQPYLQRGVG